MTQTNRSTTTHLTPAVVSLVTGAFLAPADQIMDVISDLTLGTVLPDDIEAVLPEIRAELIRQLPWLGEIQVPDFNDPDSTATKGGFAADLAERFGGSVQIECGTLALPPGVPANAKIVRNP